MFTWPQGYFCCSDGLWMSNMAWHERFAYNMCAPLMQDYIRMFAAIHGIHIMPGKM
jgi:hypothetical protein